MSVRSLKLTFLLVAAAAVALAQPSKETFYTQAKRMIIRLEYKLPSDVYASAGTGFFVQDEQNNIFVVTASHVASLGVNLRARVPSLLSDGKATDVIELHSQPHFGFITKIRATQKPFQSMLLS